MSSHEAQLRDLVRSGRISSDDAGRLAEAIASRHRWWMWLVNPFDRLSTATSWTIAAMVWAASLAVSLLGVRFDGALDMHRANEVPPFGVALFDLAVAVLLTAFVFWMIGYAFAGRGRFIDHFVTISVARVPYVFAAFLAAWLLPPPDVMLQMVLSNTLTPTALVASVLLIPPCFLWFLLLLNRAFKVSTGLKNARLGVAFAIAVVAAEVLSKVALAMAARVRVLLLALLCVGVGMVHAAEAQDAHPAAGVWTGQITLPTGASLEVTIALQRDAAGAWTGTIDIPAQGARGLPLGDIAATEETVSFRLLAGQGDPRVEGTLSDDGQTLSGTFRQAGATMPLTLRRGSATGSPAAARTDWPGEPATVDVPGGVLHGTLRLPSGQGPYPVALLIAGSGPTDRHGNSALLPGANDSLALLAERLAESGVASLRYDKRGIGQSREAGPAREEDLRFETLVDDASAWVKRLQDDDRFTTVTVIGHSEGSLIGMLAAERAGADAFVSIAGVGRPAPAILREQMQQQLPPPLLAQAERILAALESGRTTNDVPPQLATLFRPSVQPYLMSWFAYDPSEAIDRLQIPVLVVQGTTDIQVNVSEAHALHAAKPDASLVIIEGMNHVLKMVPSDPERQRASYSDPTLPVAPQLIARLLEFVASVRPRG